MRRFSDLMVVASLTAFAAFAARAVLALFAAGTVWAVGMPQVSVAQTPRLLRFDVPVQELGRIREVDGPVKVRYRFTNIADRPVTLLDVHTQCGCFEPRWQAGPVAPGGEGVIEATFDPKNRFGEFSIGLTVISTNGDYRKFNTLKVAGDVISRLPEEEIFYPCELSKLFRSDVKTVGMRLFQLTDGPRTRQIRLFNRTGDTLRPRYRSGSRFLRMTGPAEIAPRSEAIVVYELDPRGMSAGDFAIPSVVEAAGAETVIEVRGRIGRQ